MPTYDEWDQRTADLLEAAYVAAGAGPGGSGSGDLTEGGWRAKRQHLAVPFDRDGDWLDVGCANGHLMATLPGWVAERGPEIEPFGLELLPTVAELARTTFPHLADRIWAGSAMSWTPPRRFDFVTVLEDCVPPVELKAMVKRMFDEFVSPGGRLIVSSYANRDVAPRPLFDELAAHGFAPDGRIHIDRPGRFSLVTAWIDHPDKKD